MPTGTMVVFCRDLMAASTLVGHIQSAGREGQVVQTTERLLEVAPMADVIILDLAAVGTEVQELIGRLHDAGCEAPIWAFGPHVQQAMLSGAEKAGCELVLPRGQFLMRLPSLLRREEQPKSPLDLNDGEAG